jgi:hypothetical protein
MIAPVVVCLAYTIWQQVIVVFPPCSANRAPLRPVERSLSALLGGSGRGRISEWGDRGRFNNYSSGARGGEAGLVRCDVVDGVGCYRVRVYDDVADELSIEERSDAEVEVGQAAIFLVMPR